MLALPLLSTAARAPLQRQPDAAGTPPSLLLFYHVPKTGGTTLREWLFKNAGIRSPGLRRRLHGFIRYYEANCFMCLQFASVLGGVHPLQCTNKERHGCARQFNTTKTRPAGINPLTANWRHAGRVAVEFHGPTERLFTDAILPRADALRRLYERHGGTCTLLTLSREPVDLLFSTFHMWPPRPKGNDFVVPFPAYAQTARGLLTASFDRAACRVSSLESGTFNNCACDARSAERAIAALRRFDYVGLTACLRPYVFSVVEALLGFPPEASAADALRRQSKMGNASNGLIHAQPTCNDCSPAAQKRHRVWSWEGLNASERAQLRGLIAQCDDATYAESSRLAAGLMANASNASECVRAEVARHWARTP